MTTTENGQRDDLARDIFLADNSSAPEELMLAEWESDSADHHRPYAQNIADGLIAKGYRKPRSIATVEELDALPDGSLVLTEGGYWEASEWRGRGSNWWKTPGVRAIVESEDLTLPAIVLHEPEATNVDFALATAAATGVPMTEAQVREYIARGAQPEAEALA